MKNPDMLWKIFTTALGVIVVPLAGWVWSVNVEVAQLRNDVGDLFYLEDIILVPLQISLNL